MKRCWLLLLIAAAVLSLVACSGTEKEFSAQQDELEKEEVMESREEEEKAEEASLAHIRTAEAQIASIGTVTAEKKNAIQTAEEAYNALSSTEQLKVSNYLDLVAARTALDEMLAVLTEAQKAYEQIVTSSMITAEDALRLLQDYTVKNARITALQKDLAGMCDCDGVFVFHGKYNDYPAVINFYLSEGEYCFSLEYDNFLGTIKDGVISVSEDPSYVFVGKTTGTVKNTGVIHNFTVKIGSGGMNISFDTTSDDLFRT